MSSHVSQKIAERGAIKKIGVVGMGYVGIPAAMLFADVVQFEKVYGFQRESATSGYKIEMLNRGESPLKGEEPGLEDLIEKVVDAGKFECTIGFFKDRRTRLQWTLSIQTPFLNKRDLLPNFSALKEGLKNVGRYLRPGMLVVLESTVTPGVLRQDLPGRFLKRSLALLPEPILPWPMPRNA